MCTYDHLGEAIERGLISEVDIDLALKHTLATRFKLGMFDPPEIVPYAAIKMDVVNSPEHRQAAHEAALKSVVLLMNRKDVLPVQVDKVRSIFVTGPNAGNVDVLLGNYNGMSDTLTTLLEGIVACVPEGIKVEYRIGCQLVNPSKPGRNWSMSEAAGADLTIACMGIAPLMEGEEGEAIISDNTGDRNDIRLPAVQVEFLRHMAEGGAKIVLLVTGGSPIALGEVEDYVHAILYIGYPGQEGGKAVGELLFGKAVPSGKLPITFPRSVDQLPPFEDYSMKGRTYRYADWEPLYPFGFGLSYTHFAYSELTLAKSQLKSGTALKLSVKVENTGMINAEEVVQVYLKDLEASTVVPIHKLVAFKRVALNRHQSKVVEFILEPESMMLVDDEGKSVLEPGAFKVTVGGCSPGKRGLTLGAPTPQEAEFQVV
jgi:beta-glucosidase